MPAEQRPIRLRDLSFPLRVAATCLLLVIAGGYAASLYFMVHHVSQKDGDPEFSWIDIVGTYHGVDKRAPILVALDKPNHADWLQDVPAADLQILRDWLALGSAVGGGADPVQDTWDALPPGAPEEALTPADVIDERCVRCHSPSATDVNAHKDVALGRWPTLKNFVYSKKLEPISKDILAQSTHAHALSIPVFTLIACGMLLATCWPRWFRHGVAMAAFGGLLLDFGGMWLARTSEIGCHVLVLGGALYGVALVSAIAASLVAMWFGRSSESS